MLDIKAKEDCCEEAAIGNPLPFYMPCNEPATSIVGWEERSEGPYRMCECCAYHNIKNRGAKYIGPYIPKAQQS